MKILVVCQYYHPENFSISSLCERFVSDGHEVFVVTGKPNYGYGKILEGYERVEDEVIRGVRVHRVNLVPRSSSRFSIVKNYLSFWKNSKAYLKRLDERFDVVYSMSLSPIISISGANLYCRKNGVPHVLHCLDLWPESVAITHAVSKANPLYWALYLWSRAIYSKVDKVLISSPSFEDYFRRALRLKKLPIVYVPQPPYSVAQEGEDMVYSHAYNLVYAGNIGTLQLVENLAKATAIVAKEVDVCLHLIGMGSRSEAVMEWAKENGVEDRILFYGTRPRAKTACYFKNATAIVVSLVKEGVVGKTIPSKLNSSMCYGKPILACIGGDGAKVLEEARGSIFSRGETEAEIAEAIRALCALSDSERERLGENNRRYFDEHFSMDKISTAVEEALEAEKESV